MQSAHLPALLEPLALHWCELGRLEHLALLEQLEQCALVELGRLEYLALLEQSVRLVQSVQSVRLVHLLP
jgi:hypothetical protein